MKMRSLLSACLAVLMLPGLALAQDDTNDADLPVPPAGVVPPPVNGLSCEVEAGFTGLTFKQGRLFRDTIPSSCPAKAFPGEINPGTTYNYETYSFTNVENNAVCVTVDFDPDAGASPCGTNAHASAYSGSFDPMNIATNYVGDVGSSVAQPFSFEIPAAGDLVLVVENTSVQEICTFGFEVIELPCFAGDSASFRVTKDFSDDNPAEVEVTLNCFTGLPITQSQTISEAQDVNFIVESFEDDELDCNVTEVDVSGYSASYDNGQLVISPDECAYEDVGYGEEYECTITNTPEPVEVSVFKDWIIEGEGGDSIDPYYRLVLACRGEIVGGSTHGPSGIWRKELYDGSFLGTSDAEFNADVVPDWDGGTACWVLQTVYDIAVEVNNGCGSN
ncbi:MAG TPA: hypothetical protein VKN35_14715, partial [Xanthomonadales bacterium]|nr:hypothetical protein [Xanthomonadales bacterium]